MKDKQYYEECKKKAEEPFEQNWEELDEELKRVMNLAARIKEIRKDGWTRYIVGIGKVNSDIIDAPDENLSKIERDYKNAVQKCEELIGRYEELEEKLKRARYQEKNDKFFEDIQNEDVKVIYLTQGREETAYYDMILALKDDEIIGTIPLPVYRELGGEFERIDGSCRKAAVGFTYKECLENFGVYEVSIKDAILAGYDKDVEEFGGWDLFNSLAMNDYDKVMERINDPQITNAEIARAQEIIEGYESPCYDFLRGNRELRETLREMVKNLQDQAKNQIHEMSEVGETVSGVTLDGMKDTLKEMQSATKDEKEQEKIIGE